jgi:hypothetical protein
MRSDIEGRRDSFRALHRHRTTVTVALHKRLASFLSAAATTESPAD